MPICPLPIRNRGFTLIEMLVVLTILGLVGAILAISLRTPSDAREARYARQVLRAAFAEAALEARRTGRPALVAPGKVAEGAALAPALPAARADHLAFYPDGSSSGGRVSLAGKPVLEIDWLSGEVADAGG